MIVAAVALATALSFDPQIVEGLRHYHTHPVDFVREMLRGDPMPLQAELLDALVTSPKVAVHTGHNCGKTAFLSWAALWYSATRPYSKVIDTAPTYERQVKKIFWPELKQWAARLPAPQGFKITTTDLVWDDGWFITGQSAAQGENIAGFNSRHGVMYLVDEAAGVEDAIFEAIEGALSSVGGESRLVLAGNPTRTTGEFYRAKTVNRKFYSFHHLSSWDSPLVAKAWCEEKREKWGEQSSAYRSRVLGLPPLAEKDALIPFHKIEESVERGRALVGVAVPNVAPRVGVDVAYQGDDSSVVAKRFAHVLSQMRVVSGYDSVQVGKLVQDEVVGPRPPASLAVDGIGYGAGVVAWLREKKVPVADVNVGERSAKPEDFENVRAELCWAMREWFMADTAAIPDDDILVGELSELRTRYTKTGRVAIEPKLEMKKRIGRSPDRADALMLTFASNGPDLAANPPAIVHSETYNEGWGAL